MPRTPSRSRSRSRSPVVKKEDSRSASRSRSRSRSSSQSRSPVGKRRRYSRSSRSKSKSRSRSRSPRKSRRSRSKSPMSNRKRHVGDKDAPPPSKCLGVFGLSFNANERDVEQLFAKYGRVDNVKVVRDRGTGRSRGFCFINFESITDAQDAKERLDGEELDGKKIRIDYSITQRAHTPTPGKYFGRPDQAARGGSRRYSGGGGGGGGGYNRGYGGGGGGGGRYSDRRSRSRSRSPYYRRDRY